MNSTIKTNIGEYIDSKLILIIKPLPIIYEQQQFFLVHSTTILKDEKDYDTNTLALAQINAFNIYDLLRYIDPENYIISNEPSWLESTEIKENESFVGTTYKDLVNRLQLKFFNIPIFGIIGKLNKVLIELLQIKLIETSLVFKETDSPECRIVLNDTKFFKTIDETNNDIDITDSEKARFIGVLNKTLQYQYSDLDMINIFNHMKNFVRVYHHFPTWREFKLNVEKDDIDFFQFAFYRMVYFGFFDFKCSYEYEHNKNKNNDEKKQKQKLVEQESYLSKFFRYSHPLDYDFDSIMLQPNPLPPSQVSIGLSPNNNNEDDMNMNMNMIMSPELKEGEEEEENDINPYEQIESFSFLENPNRMTTTLTSPLEKFRHHNN